MNKLMPTFGDKLMRLAEADSGSVRVELDVASLVKDLAREVDRIKDIKDQLETMEQHFLDKAKPWLEAAKSCKTERQRLLEECKADMLTSGTEKMPGEDWRMQVQNGPEHVEWLQETPSRFDYDLWPQYVLPVFKWDKDVVEARLREGGDLPFARLKRSKALRFYLNKDRVLDLKKKKELKP